MSIHSATSTPLRITVIVGSVRHERLAPAVAGWLLAELYGFDGLKIDPIDLAEVELPLEGRPPGGGESVISARLAAADGFVVVTPEYNHSFPAA